MTKEESLNKLNSIAEYKQDWNGYRASPIDKDIIKKCRTIINEVIVTPEVFPTANNSIHLEYESSAYIELDVFLDKITLFVHVNDSNWAEVDLHSIKQAIQWWNVLTAMS